MCSDQYQEHEYLFNHYNKVLKQPINDLSIFTNKNTKTYLSMHGSKFVSSLISKNKDIRLNMRTVSILPILEIGHIHAKIAISKIAESFHRNNVTFLSSLVNLDRLSKTDYLQLLSELAIYRQFDSVDQQAAIALAKKNVRTRCTFAQHEHEEWQQYHDELEFFRKVFSKYRYNDKYDNMESISSTIVYYEKHANHNKPKVLNSLRKSILQFLEQTIDALNSIPFRTIVFEDFLASMEQTTNEDNPQKQLEDFAYERNLKYDLEFLSGLKKRCRCQRKR